VVDFDSRPRGSDLYNKFTVLLPSYLQSVNVPPRYIHISNIRLFFVQNIHTSIAMRMPRFSSGMPILSRYLCRTNKTDISYNRIKNGKHGKQNSAVYFNLCNDRSKLHEAENDILLKSRLKRREAVCAAEYKLPRILHQNFYLIAAS
jgi:hypothetical protein